MDEQSSFPRTQKHVPCGTPDITSELKHLAMPGRSDPKRAGEGQIVGAQHCVGEAEIDQAALDHGRP